MESNRKKARVIMLPASKESGVNLYKDKLYSKPIKKYEDIIAGTMVIPGPLIEKSEPKHLYFTTGDTIKEGDWVILNVGNINPTNVIGTVKDSLSSYDTLTLSFSDNKDLEVYEKHCRKIIASTDDSLITLIEDKDNPYDPRSKTGFEPYNSALPTPSKAFVEKYCKLGGIPEVEVDHIEYSDSQSFHYIPKVNLNNEITIRPIKTSYTLEEMHKLMDDYQDYLFKTGKPVKTFKEWFNTL